MGDHASIDAEIWARGNFVSAYANRQLRPVEVILLARYRDALAGRVLELGCGAGRITGYLEQMGATVLGVDISPRMIEYCRQRYPGGRFELGDLRHPEALAPDAPFHAALAGNNLVDVLEHAERAQVFARIAKLLAPGGWLIFSSHNLAYAPHIPGPLGALNAEGKVQMLKRLGRVPQWIVNRRRMRRLEYREAEYAVLNDQAHDFRLLHHYITRDAEEAELRSAGFALVECLDEDGRVVPRGQSAPYCAELHYVARVGSVDVRHDP